MQKNILSKTGKTLSHALKNETVLSVAIILAAVSAFFVKPDKQYFGYIDVRTLSLLFSLMAVMAGFQSTGVFGIMAERLIKKVHSIKGLVLIQMMLCFFFSMLITNDVALLTFVPFTLETLDMLGGKTKRRLLIRVTVMQTVAANLGSMLTPIGNPQNLYLQGISGIGIAEFILLMLPYTAASLLLILIWICLRGGKENADISFFNPRKITDKRKITVYFALFVLCLMSVVHVVNHIITLVTVAVVMAITDRRIFAKVDYSLLATFAAFFVFIGNMGRIPVFSNYISNVISGNECMVGIASSQLISNVPAALLLSGFTDNLKPLIIGVNLGGLGTIIASMASLITFKFVSRDNSSIRGKYMLYFTAANIIMLAALIGVYMIFGKQI